jgi:hypothetical protein
VNHNSVNLKNCHCKLIATAPQVDAQFLENRVLNQFPESTQFTDSVNDSCLLVHMLTDHATQHDAEMQMLRQHSLVHVCLKALKILWKVVADAAEITRKCNCETCMQRKLTQWPFTLNTTSHARQPLQLVHWTYAVHWKQPLEEVDICYP